IGLEGSAFRFIRASSKKLPSAAIEQRTEFLQSDIGARVVLFQTCFPDTGVIEHRCRIENAGTKTLAALKRFDPVLIYLRGDAGPIHIHTIDRVNYTIQRTELDREFEATGGTWNRPKHAGWVAIENSRAAEFLVIGVEWERDWSVQLQRDGSAIRL